MNKKLISTVAVASFVALFSATALSAPVANLKVSGDIKPPTCVVNNGDADILFDFGAISPNLIPTGSIPYSLPSLISNINVTCDATTYLSFKSEDTYSSTIYPEDWQTSRKAVTFSIVNANDTNKAVGGVVYDMISPMVDGIAVNFSRGNDGADPQAGWGGSNRIIKGATMGWTLTDKNAVSPSDMDFKAGKIFTADIKTSNDSDRLGSNTYILPKDKFLSQDMNLAEGIDYISQATLTFSFGL